MAEGASVGAVKRVMAEVFEVDAASIDDAAAMGELPGWDSGNHVVLVMALEEELGVAFSVDEIETMLTLPDIMEILDSKR